ncbi:MAG: helix-turn-helix transcriptional regulator [Cyanobacteria bacterium P01_A01_bin.123]
MEGVPMSHVAELRKQCDLTQRELADLVGVTETTVRNWENNRSGVEWFVRVAKLCEALKCSPNDLVKFVDIEGRAKDDA